MMWPFRRPDRSEAFFPPGRVGYAVGDVHGRADLLKRLLSLLEADVAASGGGAPVVVFLGDYVDRGPQSREVIDLLLDWRPDFERRFLLGNHEQAMLGFLGEPEAFRGWLQHGGMDTLRSYGVRPPPPTAAAEDLQAASRGLAEALPAEHLSFLESLELSCIYGDYFFAHAGIDPDKPLEAQTAEDLLWVRDRFLSDDRRGSHVVVHGHTPQEEPYRDRRRIGVDTGAFASGRLTAARLEGGDVRFLEARAGARETSLANAS